MPTYPNAPVPQYYIVGAGSGTAVVLPGATIKIAQTLETYLNRLGTTVEEDPENAACHADYIQAGFNLAVRNALDKIRGYLPPDEGDTYTKRILDPTKVVSVSGWEFKFRPPTYPGGSVQLVAARCLSEAGEQPGAENGWEDLDDPHNPSAQLQGGIKPDPQYAADFNETLQKSGDFGQAGQVAEGRYYDRQWFVRSGQSERSAVKFLNPRGIRH